VGAVRTRWIGEEEEEEFVFVWIDEEVPVSM
jgi:hypothetical protein